MSNTMPSAGGRKTLRLSTRVKGLARQSKVGLGALLFAGLLGPAAAAQDLLDSYRHAVADDPQLAAAAAALRAEREQLPQARSLFLPQIGLEAGQGRTRQNIDGMPSMDSYDTTAYGVALVQPLFRKESFTRYGQAQLAVEQAELSHALALQELGLRLSQAYFDVLLAEDSLRSFEAELAAISRQLQTVNRALEVGAATTADVNDAQARYDLTQARRLQALNEVRMAHETLRGITGQSMGELATLDAEFDPVPPTPGDSQSWTARAERDNLQIRLAQRNLALIAKEVERQQAQRYPTVDLVARYGRQDGVRMGGMLDELDVTESSVWVQLQMPLYTGGAVSAQVRESQARKDQALEQVRQATRAAGLAAESAYLQVNAHLEQVRALEQALSSMRDNEYTTQRSVEAGLRTTLDLLDIQRERFATERDLAAARYGYLLSYMELQAAVGAAIGEEVIEEINRFLVVKE